MPAGPTWINEQRFNRLVVAGVGLGFLVLVAAAIGAMITIRQNQNHTAWVNHTYQVERQISRFRVLLERSEAARRGMLLSDSPLVVRTFETSVEQIAPTLEVIGLLTRDNARQQANVAQIRTLLARELVLLRRSAALVQSAHRGDAIAEFKATREAGLVRSLRGLSERVLSEEDRLLTIRNAAQESTAHAFTRILAASGVLLVAVAIGSLWVILRYTRDLTRSRRDLRRLNENLEGAVRERTVDLQRANDEIQRFAYIVSHDLRSPLVNVMGFTAELEAATKALAGLIDRVEQEAPGLASTDAKLAAREDLPEAIGFIRASTQKMDRLINAILRLSREGRRPITPERLDLDAIAQGIVDTLRHRINELGATVVIRPGLPGIESDRLAVEQILSNIVENALKYLQPGRPGHIALDGSVEAGRAVFTIADNGRGIDPRDHDRIFDLFRRSGVQDQPGEGIGLAHTRALAYRLGGTISVESRLGEGATFRVVLPLIYSSEQGPSS